MPSRTISAFTTEVPNSTSDLVGNVGSTTRRFNAGQLTGAIFTSQGQIIYAASSRNSTFLNPPTSGAVLTYSSGSSAPSWAIPTNGAVLVASSLGVPTWRALGTAGQILQSTGGTPTWVDQTSLGTTERFIVTRDTSLAMTSNAWVAIGWNAEIFDSDNMHSTSVDNAGVTLATSGTWIFGVQALILTSAQDYRALQITDSVIVLAETNTWGAYGSVRIGCVGMQHFASSGSVLRVYAYSAGTTNEVSTNTPLTRFWGHRIA